MALYKIVWSSMIFGESFVEANSKAEAELKVLANKNKDFIIELLDANSDWEVKAWHCLSEEVAI